jgi:pimeloyl-ACP methyl ester carboxylesterase
MDWRETEEQRDRARAEEPVVVPCSGGNLVGILTPPSPDAVPAGMCAVFLARPRFEQRRVTVEMARRLAANGFACFRFDQQGWGDSEGDFTPMDVDEPRIKELSAVLRYLKGRGLCKFVLWGLCLDARTALAAFRSERDSLAGLAFLSAPVTRLASPRMFTWKNLLRFGFDPQRWRELLFSGTSRREAFKAVRFALRGLVKGPGDSISSKFRADFTALVTSKARALFLYGAEDGEYQSFRIAEEQLFPKLDAATRRRLEIEVWPGGVHSVFAIDRQREIVEKSISWIDSLHPARTENHTKLAAVG